jgi:hypothetical protein
VRDAEFLAQQRERWATSGERLVHLILIRRRIKCLRSGKHTIGRCPTCGVHQ